MSKRPSMGRQKIKIAKIENSNHLHVTFSKRRAGLFKRAHELSTLCGVELALIVFSPAGKVFSYGSPGVEQVASRFRNGGGSSGGGGAAPNPGVVGELNARLTQIENQIAMEKKRGEVLDAMRGAAAEQNSRCWWREEYPHPLGEAQLEQLKDTMEELKRRVADQAGKIMAETTGSNSPFFYHAGGPFAAGPSTSATPNPYGSGSYGYGPRGPL